MENQQVEILAISNNKVTIALTDGSVKDIKVENTKEISIKSKNIWINSDVVLADLVDSKLINIR